MNPYSNRKLPVGDLNYSCKYPGVVPPWDGAKALLEFGEEKLIYSIPQIVEGGPLANLGCERGGSAILLGKGLRDNKLEGIVHTIDLYDKGNFESAKRSMQNHGVSDRIEQHIGSTEKWGRKFTELKLTFNFIFIDAAHTYEAVKLDYEIWAPLLNPQGLIAFHDTNQEQIDQVIKENLCSDGWKQVYWVNRIKVFKRNK